MPVARAPPCQQTSCPNLRILATRRDSRITIVMSSCGQYQTQFRYSDVLMAIRHEAIQASPSAWRNWV